MNEKLLKTGFVLVMVMSVVLCASMATVAAPPQPPKPPYIQLSADPPAIVADGSSTSVINASVWVWDDDEGYIPIIGLVVEFSTDLGEITASATIENATATAILTAGTVEGIATITAEVDLGEEGIITNTTTVNFTAPGDGGNDNGGNGGGGNGGSGGSGGTTTTPTPTAGETTTLTPDATATSTVSPTASPTETGTPTATESPMPSPSPTKKPLIPGFEAVFVIAGLLTVAYLVLGRKRK